MPIEISSPEVEALILERMAIGRFSSPEAAVFDALRQAPSPSPRTRYTMDELLAGYHPEPSPNDKDSSWLDLVPVGREL